MKVSRLAVLEIKLSGSLVNSSPNSLPTSSQHSHHTVSHYPTQFWRLHNPFTNSLIPILSQQPHHTVSYYTTPILAPRRLNHQSLFLKTPFKMDNPRFDGNDALGWIFTINSFFNFHNTQEKQRISIASFYLDGPALNWHQWMYNKNQLNSW